MSCFGGEQSPSYKEGISLYIYHWCRQGFCEMEFPIYWTDNSHMLLHFHVSSPRLTTPHLALPTALQLMLNHPKHNDSQSMSTSGCD